MGIKLKQFSFVLDRPGVYRPGEVVTGYCLIGLGGKMNLSQLNIKLEGVAQCQWTETRTVSNGKGKTRRVTRTISASCILLDLQYNPGNVYPHILTPGVHRIEIKFQLPSMNLPSSFEAYYGRIWYKLTGKIHTPIFTFDKRNELDIKIKAPAYFSMPILMREVRICNKKTIGFFGAKKLRISCHMQRIGHNIGSSIPIVCFIENNSKKTIALRATLKQRVRFCAEGRIQFTKNIVMLTRGKNIDPLSKQSQLLLVHVPAEIPVTLHTLKLINIEYKIIVTLVIPFSFNLNCELPCIITDETFTDDDNQANNNLLEHFNNLACQ